MPCSMLGANQKVHEQCSPRQAPRDAPGKQDRASTSAELAPIKEMGLMKDTNTEQNGLGAGQGITGSASTTISVEASDEVAAPFYHYGGFFMTGDDTAAMYASEATPETFTQI